MAPDSELFESFLEEASDYLSQIRSQLAPALEGERLSARRTKALLGAVHSLKGVSGLLGFSHLHALVARLEQNFTDLASPSAAGIAPALASGAIKTLERMIENIATGSPGLNEDVLLEFELAAEIYTVVAEPKDATAAPAPADLTSFDDGSLAAALAEEIMELVDTTGSQLIRSLDESTPGPRQLVAAVARPRLSSLADTAAMTGRRDVADFARALASVMDDIATGRRPADLKTVDLAIRGMNALGRLGVGPPDDPSALVDTRAMMEEAGEQMAELLEGEPSALGGDEEDEALAELRELFTEEAGEHLRTARDALEELEKNPANDESIHAFFRATHTLKGAAGTVGLHEVMDAAHELEELFTKVRDGQLLVDESVLAKGRAGLARLRELAGVDRDMEPHEAPAPRAGPSVRVPLERLDALLLQAGELLPVRARVTEASARLRELGRLVDRRRRDLAARIDDFTAHHSFSLPGRRSEEDDSAQGLGGLEFDQYDEVNVLARDLADLDFNLAEAIHSLTRLCDDLGADVEGISDGIATLQEGLTRARFVPMSEAFDRFVHAAADWGREEGKQIELVIEGAATEVDRSVADAIVDPLVHLVRNAVTHGIETPKERARVGKAAAGRIVLRARQEGRDVLIEVEDDGRGLDPASLRRAAISRGIFSAEEAAATSDARIVEVIFTSGFSTREQASTLGGRGVGLDVVATTISRLGGVISVTQGTLGGTLFAARVPATVAILPVLTVAAAGQVFALPLAAVQETLLVDRRELERASCGARIRWRGGELRAVSLSRLTRNRSIPTDGPRRLPVVVVGHADRTAALVVERLLTREEGLVKSLGPILGALPLYASAVIGGDGYVRLVLDPSSILAASIGTQIGPRSAPHESSPPPGRPRVLVVDDSLSVRTYLSKIIRSMGVDVEVAPDGEVALERLRIDHFDLVLTDLEMPRLHGFDLLARMREAPELARIPALVISSRAGRKHRDRAASLGAREFLTKPVSRDVLIDRVNAWLGGD